MTTTLTWMLITNEVHRNCSGSCVPRVTLITHCKPLGVVWNENKQSHLINSIFRCALYFGKLLMAHPCGLHTRNMWIPPVVFARTTGSTRRVCIDGKQVSRDPLHTHTLLAGAHMVPAPHVNSKVH
jgi:hypothetical protein